MESLHTLFLAQAMGLYFFLMAILLLSRANYYKALFARIHEGSATIALAGTVGLILGIILVLVHNLWVFQSEVLITLLAWIILIKSILWLAFPAFMVRVTQRITTGASYYIMITILGILGIILMAHGFYLFKACALAIKHAFCIAF